MGVRKSVVPGVVGMVSFMLRVTATSALVASSVSASSVGLTSFISSGTSHPSRAATGRDFETAAWTIMPFRSTVIFTAASG